MKVAPAAAHLVERGARGLRAERLDGIDHHSQRLAERQQAADRVELAQISVTTP